MKFLRAGFGNDLDAAVAHAIVFGGKRILIHADFEDVRFGWNLAALESVTVDLPAVGTGSRSGKRLQFILQFSWVVGERIDGAAFEDDCARVLVGTEADGLRLAFNLHLLLLNRDGEEKFQLF